MSSVTCVTSSDTVTVKLASSTPLKVADSTTVPAVSVRRTFCGPRSWSDAVAELCASSMATVVAPAVVSTVVAPSLSVPTTRAIAS